MIEFALVMPLLVLVLMAVFDLGRGVYSQNVVASAAREGARYGIFRPLDLAAIEQQAKANTAALDQKAITVTTGCTLNDGATAATCAKPNLLNVTVKYTFHPVTLLFTPLTLTAKSAMMIEVAP